MIKTRKNSRIEVWGANYINKPDKRLPRDKDADIIQIECGCGATGENYIVEVLDKKESGK